MIDEHDRLFSYNGGVVVASNCTYNNYIFNMKICTKVIVLCTAFFVFTQMSVNADYDYYEDEPIYPHQEHRLCDSRHCENTCARPDAQSSPCPFRLCHEGYFCESGYVREFETDQCILPNDCPPKTDSHKS